MYQLLKGQNKDNIVCQSIFVLKRKYKQMMEGKKTHRKEYEGEYQDNELFLFG